MRGQNIHHTVNQYRFLKDMLDVISKSSNKLNNPLTQNNLCALTSEQQQQTSIIIKPRDKSLRHLAFDHQRSLVQTSIATRTACIGPNHRYADFSRSIRFNMLCISPSPPTMHSPFAAYSQSRHLAPPL